MVLGYHIIADMYEVTEMDGKQIFKLFKEAVKYANMHETGEVYYQFDNGSSSGIVAVEESHLSFHSWAEYNSILVDVFTCGEKSQGEKAYKFIYDTLAPERVDVKRIERGIEI